MQRVMHVLFQHRKLLCALGGRHAEPHGARELNSRVGMLLACLAA